MESPKRKRISDFKAGVLMIDQVKPDVLEGTAVRFDLSKGKGHLPPHFMVFGENLLTVEPRRFGAACSAG